MSFNQTERMYFRAAAQTATPLELVILLYDMLAADLRRAIEAIHRGDIEKRASEIKHAFLVLEQLQGFLDMKNGGMAAKRLTRFYSHIRSMILEGHAKVSVELLERQIALLLDVRGAWEQVKRTGSTPEARDRALPGEPEQVTAKAPQAAETRVSSSWSA